jgi:hypothetical protein
VNFRYGLDPLLALLFGHFGPQHVNSRKNTGLAVFTGTSRHALSQVKYIELGPESSMERYEPCVFDTLNLICDNSFFSGVICDNSNLSFDSLNLISNNSKFCTESSNFHSST